MGYYGVRSHFFLIILSVRLSYTICENRALFHLTKGKEVHIVNGLPDNTHSLVVRCQSKDDDFGYHTLLLGQEFSWKFHINIFGRTLYFCHFWLQGIKDRSFDVYDDWNEKPHCADNLNDIKTCYWLVKDDGFYYSDYKADLNSSDWQKWLPWK